MAPVLATRGGLLCGHLPFSLSLGGVRQAANEEPSRTRDFCCLPELVRTLIFSFLPTDLEPDVSAGPVNACNSSDSLHVLSPLKATIFKWFRCSAEKFLKCDQRDKNGDLYVLQIRKKLSEPLFAIVQKNRLIWRLFVPKALFLGTTTWLRSISDSEIKYVIIRRRCLVWLFSPPDAVD